MADSLSTDHTLDLVRQMGGCRIIQREFINFSNFRTGPSDTARIPGRWSSMPTSGFPTNWLARSAKPSPATTLRFDAYRVISKVFFLGRLIRHCGWSNPTSIRFFRRAVCRFGHESVHESIRVDTGRVGWLRARLLHYTYRSFVHWTEKQNHYTTLWAQDKYKAGMRVTGLGILMRPLLNFLQIYFWRAVFWTGPSA